MENRGLTRPWFNALLIALVTESFIIAIGAYLSYTAIGTPLSNSVGTTIRSTVVSGWGPFILVSGILFMSLTALNNAARYWKIGLKVVFAVGLMIAVISTPFLIYYNFFYAYSEVISGTTYLVYPYAVQAAIPFMLGILVAFTAGISLLAEKYRKRKVRYRVTFSWRGRKGD